MIPTSLKFGLQETIHCLLTLTRLVYSDGEDRIQIKRVGLDSGVKGVSEGPHFMRGTVPGTARRFWAGLLAYAFIWYSSF